MFMLYEATIPLPTIYDNGLLDSGQAHVTPEGLVIETMVAKTFALEWEDLLRIIDEPAVQERLAEAARKRGE